MISFATLTPVVVSRPNSPPKSGATLISMISGPRLERMTSTPATLMPIAFHGC
jgi:hypothetical protein